MINEDMTTQRQQEIKMLKLTNLLIRMLLTYLITYENDYYHFLTIIVNRLINGLPMEFTEEQEKIAGNWIITYKEDEDD